MDGEDFIQMGDDADEEAFLQRIRDAIQAGGGVPAMAERTGIPKKTLEKYLAKSRTASFANATRIAAAAGIPISVLAGEPLVQMQTQSIVTAVVPAEAMRVVDQVLRRVYREDGVKLPADALMPETIRHLQALVSRMDNPADEAEARSLAPWLENRIRTELKAAAAAPGTGKREAS
ncbi:hypothetical protein [Mesorhizobium sp. J428]|uniref:hypothetical protein n=1 Tax=Mesorhizobium sp. J428 TaxID=2898440 RepID=UPI002151B0B8|nr:hypothetical protein [Mesorhizobium sp. J428]MCR5855952.1 hypothetical protein [Mesorhizobium sp. J428]